MPGGLRLPDLSLSPRDAAGRYLEDQPDGVTVAVALSGGGDSVGLMASLCDTAAFRQGRVRLAAITVDHGMRPEAAGEAAAMADLCRTLSIPHLTMTWSGEKPTTGVSEAARRARYRLLAEAAQRLGATRLVTAHTLDDQLETVEMRRLRRASADRGLAGIAPAALFFGSLVVHRPFLAVRRAEIRAYLRERGLSWFEDPSNDNPRYERVRVRQAGQFALDSRAVLAAAGRRMALSQAAGAYIQSQAWMPLPMLFALRCRDVGEEVALHAVANLIALAGGQIHLPGEEQLDPVRAILRAEGAGKAFSLGRTVVERRKDVLYIGRDRRNLPVLQAGPAEEIVWDGRFRIVNCTGVPIDIAPAGAGAKQDGVPSRVAQRACATLPAFRQSKTALGQVTTQPFLALFETVLSSFDVAMADTLCRLTTRPLFPRFVSGGLVTSSRTG